MGFNPGNGGSSSIGASTDVFLNNVANDEVLAYDTGLTKWKNAVGGTTPDADATTKGIVQLAGDLGGTAAAPTVPGLAAKANDTAVVHLTGDESVAGVKTFSASPIVPTPTTSTQAATKAYVDGTVAGLTIAALKTTDYTAAAGELVPVDTTSGPVTITLPAAPATGTRVAVKHVAGSNAVTVNRGGSDVFNLAGGASTLGLSTAGLGVSLQYTATGGVWYSLEATPLSALGGAFAPSAGPVPTAYAASTDARFVSSPSSRKVANFTLALGDAGTIIDAESASPVTVTVPPGSSVAFLDDTLIEVTQTGLGTVTVAPGSGVTLRNSAGLSTRAQWSSLSLRKRPGGGTSLPSANMLMRFKADDIVGANGSAVSSWPESSGNGLPAATQGTVGSQPTLVTNAANGHQGVNFDGTGDHLLLSGSALDVFRNRSAAMVFVVYSYPFAVTGARTFMSFSSGTSGTSSRVVMIHRDGGTGIMSAGGRRLDTDGGVFLSGSASTATEIGVSTARFVWGSSDAYLYKNGTLSATNTSFQTSGSTSDTASLAAVLGANAAASAEFFSGRIMEILVYGVDDTDVRSSVHTYIQNTYGISVADYTGLVDEWIVSGDTVV
jgi:hypothetical protein